MTLGLTTGVNREWGDLVRWSIGIVLAVSANVAIFLVLAVPYHVWDSLDLRDSDIFVLTMVAETDSYVLFRVTPHRSQAR